MFGECFTFMQQRWEWGTMVADVDHLGHDASTDVVGL